METLKSWGRYLTRNKRYGTPKFIAEMAIREFYDFSKITRVELNENFITTGHAWGKTHPKDPFSYWAPKNVSLHRSFMNPGGQYLSLIADFRRAKIDDWQNDTVSPIRVGMVETKEKYLYGYFEVECMLPRGENCFPSFWLWGQTKGKYQEIDVLEANSMKGKYGMCFKNVQLQSNVHIGTEFDKRKVIGGKNHPLPVDVSKTFNKYGVLWLEDKIEFYYNRHMVRRVGKNIASQFTNAMPVIINNGTRPSTRHSFYNELIVSSLLILK